jgi:hypothetical protein
MNAPVAKRAGGLRKSVHENSPQGEVRWVVVVVSAAA